MFLYCMILSVTGECVLLYENAAAQITVFRRTVHTDLYSFFFLFSQPYVLHGKHPRRTDLFPGRSLLTAYQG
jgi:hypothetical protein